MQTHKTFAVGLVLAGALSLAGCANNQQLGTGVGAVGGAVLGDAVIGGTLGTLGGAAAGAIIGNQIGKNQDNK